MALLLLLMDFGVGYSSLSYLKHFPINALKIDRSFVKDIPEDKDDATITQTIISLAHNLDIGIVAEGVETEEQAQFLIERGCTIAQGFYYSKPLPVDEITQLLSQSNGVIPAKNQLKSTNLNTLFILSLLQGVSAMANHEVERESMEFDVLIVGAGPAGLSTACKLAQLNQEQGGDLQICVIEKGSEVGAHILSGAVFEPRRP